MKPNDIRELERRFEEELELLDHHLAFGYRCLHSERTLNDLLRNLQINRKIQESAAFWNTVKEGFTLEIIGTLGRVFDTKDQSKHNIDKLFCLMEQNPKLFSKASYRRRVMKRNLSAEVVADLVADHFQPTMADFQHMRSRLEPHRQKYNDIYKPIRDKHFAHVDATGERLNALFDSTNILEVDAMFRCLFRLHAAFWGLFHNATKVDLTTSLNDGHYERKTVNRAVERLLVSLVPQASRATVSRDAAERIKRLEAELL